MLLRCYSVLAILMHYAIHFLLFLSLLWQGFLLEIYYSASVEGAGQISYYTYFQFAWVVQLFHFIQASLDICYRASVQGAG